MVLAKQFPFENSYPRQQLFAFCILSAFSFPVCSEMSSALMSHSTSDFSVIRLGRLLVPKINSSGELGLPYGTSSMKTISWLLFHVSHLISSLLRHSLLTGNRQAHPRQVTKVTSSSYPVKPQNSESEMTLNVFSTNKQRIPRRSSRTDCRSCNALSVNLGKLIRESSDSRSKYTSGPVGHMQLESGEVSCEKVT